MTKDLRELQEEIAEWARYNFPKEDVLDCMLGLSEEVGELSRSILKSRQGIRGTEAEHKAAAAEEVGDILIFLFEFCTKMNLDLEKCLRDKWAKVRLRDWVAYSETGKPPMIPTSICPSCGTEFRTWKGYLLVVRNMEFCSNPCANHWIESEHDGD